MVTPSMLKFKCNETNIPMLQWQWVLRTAESKVFLKWTDYRLVSYHAWLLCEQCQRWNEHRNMQHPESAILWRSLTPARSLLLSSDLGLRWWRLPLAVLQDKCLQGQLLGNYRSSCQQSTYTSWHLLYTYSFQIPQYWWGVESGMKTENSYYISCVKSDQRGKLQLYQECGI